MAMKAKREDRPAGASEGARRATGEAPAGHAPDPRPQTSAAQPPTADPCPPIRVVRPAIDPPPAQSNPRPQAGDDRGRFSARRKAEAVLRLLRGEDLETLSRSLGVTAARLAAWRNDFLDAGAAALKKRHDSDDPRQEEVTRLKAKIGDLTMANELLETKIQRLEGGRPLAPRRSRP